MSSGGTETRCPPVRSPDGWQPWLDLIPDGVLLVDEQGRIRGANEAMHRLCGLDPSALHGRALDVLLPIGASGRHGAHLQQFFQQPRQRPMGSVSRLRLRRADGSQLPVDISLGLFEREGERLALAVIHDLSELHTLHQRNDYLATHDELTGLHNRPLFHQLLSQALAQAQRSQRSMALLLIDLDDFKSVNDGHGHHVGDRLLQDVASRMRSELRSSDALARLGGDEFAVLLPDQTHAPDTLRVAEKLLASIAKPWQLGHHEISPGASIGIVFGPGDGNSADMLMRHADMAMYQAKDAGRGTYRVFDGRMAAELEERSLLQGRLQLALRHGGLQLHYQPQLCARSGRVLGVEALARWQDAQLGMVSPARFIPVAERCGLILPLGDWVLNEACRQLRSWLDQGLALRVAVNVSAHQLRLPRFAAHLAELLQQWRIPPALLELEITESVAMGDGLQAKALLEEVARLGVQLALDDFGMGHSSLGQLRDLPVHRIKMDRSFVQGACTHARDAVLTRAVIGLTKTLGMRVVGEGVETDAQRRFLQAEGCDELQGWLFAPAVAAAHIPQLLQTLVGAAP